MRVGKVEGALLLSILAACSPGRSEKAPVSSPTTQGATEAKGGPWAGAAEPPLAAPTQPPPEPAKGSAVTAPAADIYRVSGKVVPPRVIHRVAPELGAFRAQRVVGVPIVEAIVGKDGRVKDVRVVRGINPEVDSEILGAIKQWRFQPATLDGKPVNVYFTLTMNIDWQ